MTHLMWDDYQNDLDAPVRWRSKIELAGMTRQGDVNALVPLAKSWEAPAPAGLDGSGFTGGAFDKAERAYKIRNGTAEARALKVVLHGSPDSPVLNPCFLIENWPEGVPVRLTIAGQTIQPGSAFRQGMEKTTDGRNVLVVWMQLDSTSTVPILIEPRHD